MSQTINNKIIKNQNSEMCIKLLKAQRVAYSSAKRYQAFDTTSALFAVVSPVLLIFQLRGADVISAISVGLAILLILSDIWRKRDTKIGAVIQEEFDAKLFGLEWNDVLVGPKIKTDKVISLSAKYKKDDVHNWYSPIIPEYLPQSISILLCYKCNTIWGIQQREDYRNSLIWLIVIYYIGVLVLGIYRNTGIFDVMVWIAPSLPFLSYLTTICKNQSEIVGEYKRIDIMVDNALEIYKNNMQEPDKTVLRQIQDLFYSQRIIPHKVPDWYYSFYRSNTNKLVDETLKSIINDLR